MWTCWTSSVGVAGAAWLTKKPGNVNVPCTVTWNWSPSWTEVIGVPDRSVTVVVMSTG
jgi:hypothetical protein